MAKQIVLSFLGAGLFLFLIGLVLYKPVIRPWHIRWGATDAETQASFSGDEIVTGRSVDQTTRSIDIQARADQVWPWLVQIGQGRGGMYSYDFLENLAGCDIHTLDLIDPALQDLKVGDRISLGQQEQLPYYKVMRLEPNQAMVLQSVNPTTGAPGETWGFYLVEQSRGVTRLIVRHRSNASVDKMERAINGVFDPIVFVMEHRMLHGIRERAEKLNQAILVSAAH